MQKARHHPIPKYQALTACRHTISGSLSLPSRGPFHLSLTVLLHYRSPDLFSLTRWSSRIHPGFLVSRATRDTNYHISTISATGLSPPAVGLSRPVRLSSSCKWRLSHYPGRSLNRFRLFPVRSPLLRESLLFSLPAATKMFQFTAFALHYCSDRTYCGRVAPFGYHRICARLQLPGNFRSLPRPSSPSGAKASIVCPLLFVHIDFYTCSHVYLLIKDL
jgi:hypothetical protein